MHTAKSSVPGTHALLLMANLHATFIHTWSSYNYVIYFAAIAVVIGKSIHGVSAFVGLFYSGLGS